ncbi:MAG: BTAD domain-containing putative transcriptional regulator [Anaerolineae bacterium]
MVIKFYTLGRFVLVRDGQPVTRAEWRTHRAATLCKVLLTHRGQRLHKEQLQDWIWPEASLQAASRNLRVALSELRRVLEPDRQARDESSFVESSGDTVELHADGLWVDSQQLVDVAEIDPDAPNALLRLQAAADLYRGAYLPDDLYEDWASLERERLELAHETVLLRLAQAYALNAQHAEALRVCRRALVGNPTSEVFAEHAMQYAAQAGDAAQALTVYQEFCAALETRFQLRPSPRLAELAQGIREQPHHSEAAMVRVPLTSQDARPRLGKTVVFVEAQTVEATLRRSYELIGDVAIALQRISQARSALASSAERAWLAANSRQAGD